MTRVLFVDDEPHVLDGIQNLLRRQRRIWQMHFAVGGQAALDELDRQSYDVIVSDMLMPAMDGATLLQHVRQRHPSIIRIVLSGHAEPEQISRVLAVSHQYLSKPCDGETLRSAIERACELRAFVAHPVAREVVGRLATLPSVPGLYWELTRRVSDPKAGPKDIADVVARDPAMAAKVLQIVNSAYFGLSQRVSSVHQAVAYLGIELVRGLALSAHVFTLFERTAPVPAFDIKSLQMHSLSTARLAQHLVSEVHRTDEAFVGGLLHDIGKLVLALGLPEQFAAAVEAANARGLTLNDVEHEFFGVTHAAVGAYLLGVWGLPPSVVQCAAHHHAPEHASPGYTELAAAVFVGDLIAKHLERDAAGLTVDAFVFSEYGISPDDVRRALDAATSPAAGRLAG